MSLELSRMLYLGLMEASSCDIPVLPLSSLIQSKRRQPGQYPRDLTTLIPYPSHNLKSFIPHTIIHVLLSIRWANDLRYVTP
jgi:hypothetical protein